MEGLEALGNMGVVPIVIALTQIIKRRIGDFKYGSDVLALLLSFGLCVGWEFYYMTPETYYTWAALSGLELFKWGVGMVGKGLGTWFSASKLYDFSHGNKKRDNEVFSRPLLTTFKSPQLLQLIGRLFTFNLFSNSIFVRNIYLSIVLGQIS